jgi:hypothetical protein
VNRREAVLLARSQAQSEVKRPMEVPRHLPAIDDQPITTLYVNHWTPPQSQRRQEIDECLRRNIDCPSIDRIVLLAQSTPEHRAGAPAR